MKAKAVWGGNWGGGEGDCLIVCKSASGEPERDSIGALKHCFFLP